MTDQPFSPPTEPVPTWSPSPQPPAVGGASGTVVAAGVILLVIAALAGLLGILALLGGASRTFVIVFGGVALAIGLAHLLSGIGVLRRRSWARILGLVMSVLGVLLWGLILVSTLAASGQPIPAGYLEDRGMTVEEYRAVVRTGWIVGVSLSGIALAFYTFVVVVLIRQGREFA
jgi:membrane protease YdiL (CAAX protease family)